MDRQFKFGVGTIGDSAAERTLEKLLLESKDPYLAYKVMKTIVRNRDGISALAALTKFHKMFLVLWKDHMLEVWEKRQEKDPVPPDVYTYTRNVLTKDYREALRNEN